MKLSKTSWSVFDITTQAGEITTLEEQAAAPGFWNDQDNAKRAMRQLSRLKSNVAIWTETQQRINDALELAELDDDELRADLEAEANELTQTVERLTFRAKLSGEYDAEDAYLAIHAGAG
ncbi:MAG: PCRF domain-containing protein, partial [Anaerolineae bacterium]|nr:PCRF domain-containing protein [Anaerolineae bacterium]